MNHLTRSAIVPYSDRQMFDLVNAIEEYQKFLPWCSNSHVIINNEQEIIASLEISWKGVRKSFTTRNRLNPYQEIDIALVNGPFKHLQGKWHFIALSDRGCKVLLDLEFEFAGFFIDKLFQPIFQHIANSLVDSFCKRAADVYGK